MSDFITMVSESAKGGNNEQVMWHAVSVADEMLEDIKKLSPEKYDCYMRKMHEALFGCHYTQTLALDDVDKMHHTAKDGKKVEGNYWTPEQVEEAYTGKKFPAGTTKWDKYVAANYAFHIFEGMLDDGQILEAAHRMFFAGDEPHLEGRVWRIISMTR